jgi:hypothetical protein
MHVDINVELRLLFYKKFEHLFVESEMHFSPSFSSDLDFTVYGLIPKS